MNVLLDDHWKGFVQAAVESGRFATAEDVVLEGLRLVEVREANVAELRQMIEESIADGEDLTDEEVSASLAATLAELVQAQR